MNTWTQDFVLDGAESVAPVRANDLFHVDITVPASATWRQIFIVMQGDGLGWSQHAFDALVGQTTTVTLDLEETGIRAAAQAGGGTWWQIFLIFQGDDQDGATSTQSIIDNVRFASKNLQPDPFPILDAELAGASVVLNWQSIEGNLYDVQYTEDIVAGTWGPAGPLTNIVGLADSTSVTGDLYGASTSYRVEWQAPVPIYFSDFEGDNGAFTSINHSTGGSDWEHGAPDSSGLGGNVTEGNNNSTNCWGTNIGNPGYHLSGTDVCLRSPVLDLTDVASATLRFAQAVDIEESDTAVVNIIDDVNETVIAAAIHTTVDTDTSSAPWELVGPIALPGSALGQPVRIEWRFTGEGGEFEDYMGWYIDDVEVTVP